MRRRSCLSAPTHKRRKMPAFRECVGALSETELHKDVTIGTAMSAVFGELRSTHNCNMRRLMDAWPMITPQWHTHCTPKMLDSEGVLWIAVRSAPALAMIRRFEQVICKAAAGVVPEVCRIRLSAGGSTPRRVKDEGERRNEVTALNLQPSSLHAAGGLL